MPYFSAQGQGVIEVRRRQLEIEPQAAGIYVRHKRRNLETAIKGISAGDKHGGHTVTPYVAVGGDGIVGVIKNFQIAGEIYSSFDESMLHVPIEGPSDQGHAGEFESEIGIGRQISAKVIVESHGPGFQIPPGMDTEPHSHAGFPRSQGFRRFQGGWRPAARQ